jgi:hypothetical protein
VWSGDFSGKDLALRGAYRKRAGAGVKKRISHPAVLILTSGWLISMTSQSINDKSEISGNDVIVQ